MGVQSDNQYERDFQRIKDDQQERESTVQHKYAWWWDLEDQQVVTGVFAFIGRQIDLRFRRPFEFPNHEIVREAEHQLAQLQFPAAPERSALPFQESTGCMLPGCAIWAIFLMYLLMFVLVGSDGDSDLMMNWILLGAAPLALLTWAGYVQAKHRLRKDNQEIAAHNSAVQAEWGSYQTEYQRVDAARNSILQRVSPFLRR